MEASKLPAQDNAPKWAIVYDLTLDDGAVLPQELFFGYDDGVPAVLKNSAKIFTEYAEALNKLPIAAKTGKSFASVGKPYLVEIPHDRC